MQNSVMLKNPNLRFSYARAEPFIDRTVPYARKAESQNSISSTISFSTKQLLALILGGGGFVVTGVGSIFITGLYYINDNMNNRFTGLETRMAEMASNSESRFTGIENRLETRLTGLENRIDARFTVLENRLDAKLQPKK